MLNRPSGQLETHQALPPEYLENAINALVRLYQESRSKLVASFVVRYAEALSAHPDYEGTAEQRCAWRKLSRSWLWIVQQDRQQILSRGSAA